MRIVMRMPLAMDREDGVAVYLVSEREMVGVPRIDDYIRIPGSPIDYHTVAQVDWELNGEPTIYLQEFDAGRRTGVEFLHWCAQFRGWELCHLPSGGDYCPGLPESVNSHSET